MPEQGIPGFDLAAMLLDELARLIRTLGADPAHALKRIFAKHQIRGHGITSGFEAERPRSEVVRHRSTLWHEVRKRGTGDYTIDRREPHEVVRKTITPS